MANSFRSTQVSNIYFSNGLTYLADIYNVSSLQAYDLVQGALVSLAYSVMLYMILLQYHIFFNLPKICVLVLILLL